MFMSPVWEEEGNCTFNDAETVPNLDGVDVVAVGWCVDDEGMTAMAWRSSNGFDWERILERADNAEATGVATDGFGNPVIVGRRDDAVPLVWEPRRNGGFSLVELPTEDDMETWADQVDIGFNNFMIVGNAYPDGIEGDTQPVAWLKEIGGTDWTMIEPPPDAIDFVDVQDSSVFRDGTVESARLLGEQSFAGERFTVFGYTEPFQPAIWDYKSAEGIWELTKLDGDDDVLRQSTFRAALGTDHIWTLRGEWTATDLTPFVSSADAVVQLNDTDSGQGLLLSGWQWDDNGNGYVVFLTSRDGAEWTVLPDQPEYHGYGPIQTLAWYRDRVVGFDDRTVYMSVIPTSGP